MKDWFPGQQANRVQESGDAATLSGARVPAGLRETRVAQDFAGNVYLQRTDGSWAPWSAAAASAGRGAAVAATVSVNGVSGAIMLEGTAPVTITENAATRVITVAVTLSAADIYALVKAMLLAGTDIDITADDGARTLTIAYAP